MKVEKIKLTGIARRMWGYKILTPSTVGKFVESHKLALERSRRVVFDAFGRFASVHICPEMYQLLGEDIRAMHGRVGFVYHAWIQYCADGKWLTDWENDFLLYYEPLTEEAYVFPKRVAELKTVHAWWRLKDKQVEYPLFEKDGVKISRSFLVRGNLLCAYRDVASYQPQENVWQWKYFPPLHFVYAKVPTLKELEAMAPEA